MFSCSATVAQNKEISSYCFLLAQQYAVFGINQSQLGCVRNKLFSFALLLLTFLAYFMHDFNEKLFLFL